MPECFLRVYRAQELIREVTQMERERELRLGF